jgi:two-component system, NtrC family, response regulator AtoC
VGTTNRLLRIHHSTATVIRRRHAGNTNRRLVRGRVIGPADLHPAAAAPTTEASPAGMESQLLRDILAETESRVIRQALEQEKWNRTRAAQVLGISRRQLFDKIRQYGLQE